VAFEGENVFAQSDVSR